MQKIKVFLNKNILNIDMLKEHFELVNDYTKADYLISWVELPPHNFPLNKVIYIAYEVPLTGPIYWAYSNMDLFHSVYCYNPDKNKGNQFPITIDPKYYPVSPYYEIDIRREDNILSTRGIFYCGQRAGCIYKDVPDTFGLNLKMSRDILCEELLRDYNHKVYLDGSGWDINTISNNFRKSKIERINRENSDFHLCIENYSMNNLISERLHDGFSSDRLILYYGDPNIKKVIPEDCFVDLTKFFDKKTKRFNTKELIKFMNEITLEEYMKIINNARRFRESMDRGGFIKGRNRLTKLIIERILEGGEK